MRPNLHLSTSSLSFAFVVRQAPTWNSLSKSFQYGIIASYSNALVACTSAIISDSAWQIPLPPSLCSCQVPAPKGIPAALVSGSLISAPSNHSAVCSSIVPGDPCVVHPSSLSTTPQPLCALSSLWPLINSGSCSRETVRRLLAPPVVLIPLLLLDLILVLSLSFLHQDFS